MYSKEDIYSYFKNDDYYISKNLTLSDLKSMYSAFYSSKPRTNMVKKDFIISIRNAIRSESRAKAFSR